MYNLGLAPYQYSYEYPILDVPSRTSTVRVRVPYGTSPGLDAAISNISCISPDQPTKIHLATQSSCNLKTPQSYRTVHSLVLVPPPLAWYCTTSYKYHHLILILHLSSGLLVRYPLLLLVAYKGAGALTRNRYLLTVRIVRNWPR